MKFSILLASLLILESFCYFSPTPQRGQTLARRRTAPAGAGPTDSFDTSFDDADCQDPLFDDNDSNAVIGSFNEIQRGRYNLLMGNMNLVNGNANGIFGNKNYVQGSANIIGSVKKRY